MVTGSDNSQRRAAFEALLRVRGVIDPRILHAMRTVPRHLFVPPELERRAYADEPLPVAPGKTISQPFIVATMTELAELEAGDHVLEIGTGTGYQAAVLAELVESVDTVESDAALAAQSRERLARMCYRNIRVHHADGFHGYAPGAPYDAILVTCAIPSIFAPLASQLAIGGRLVAPVGPPDGVQMLRVYEKQPDGKLTHRDIFQVRFVPFVRTPIDDVAAADGSSN